MVNCAMQNNQQVVVNTVAELVSQNRIWLESLDAVNDC